MSVTSEALPADIKKESEFILACERGNLTKVSELLGKDIALANEPASDGWTPLMFAARRGDKELAELLIKHEAEINVVVESEPHKGKTALWFAVVNKQWDMVKLLLDKGAKNLDASPAGGPDQGLSALWMAAVNQQWDVVKLLLDKGAKNLDASPAGGTDQGLTVLWMAAANQQWDVVKLLLDKGAKNLDASPAGGPDQGLTALWAAAANQQWDVVKLLLDKGAKNLDASRAGGAYQGLTALWMAAANQQWDVVKLLLDKGAKNLDASPAGGAYQGSTALWMAAANQQWDVVKLLLDKGAKNLDASLARGSNQGKTALWWVIVHGNDELFRGLLAKGASLELPGNAHVNTKVIAEELRAAERELSHRQISTTFNNVMALFELANNSKLDAEAMKLQLETLLTKDLVLNARINGETALHVAIRNENWTVVEALVLAGADLSLTSNEGQTAESLLESSPPQDLMFSSLLPLIKAFTKLQKLPKKLAEMFEEDKTKKGAERKESKEEVEQLQQSSGTPKPTLSSVLEDMLVAGQSLKPLQRATFYSQLGELLHNKREQDKLPILAKYVGRAYAGVPAEVEELYVKIRGRKAFYEILGKQISPTETVLRALELETDPMPSSFFPDSVRALLTYRSILKAVLGTKDEGQFSMEHLRQTLATLSQALTSADGVKGALMMLHQEFQAQQAEISSLREEIRVLKDGQSQSSSSSSAPSAAVAAIPKRLVFSDLARALHERNAGAVRFKRKDPKGSKNKSAESGRATQVAKRHKPE